MNQKESTFKAQSGNILELSIKCKIAAHLLIAPKQFCEFQFSQKDTHEHELSSWPFETNLLHRAKSYKKIRNIQLNFIDATSMQTI